METIKKWFWYIVAVGVLLLFAVTCSNSIADKYMGEGRVYEKQLERKIELLNKAKLESKKLTDSLHTDNKKKDAQIAELNIKNGELDGKLADAGKRIDIKIKEIRNFKYKDGAEFLAEHYDLPQSVSYNDKGITMTDSLPNKVIEDVAEKEYFKEALSYTEMKLGNTEEKVVIQESVIENKDKEIKSILEVSAIKDEALEASKDVIDNKDKQIKKIKTARTLERIFVGVGVVISVILIAK